ncbi:hypothetical protein TNCV_2607921 [Trichonephila clavipes]|uniref:Uncharacterized protein n=1 Tax=Trichonephila clavipes TaxID=2585209 RepID=A0A8X6S6Z1_TRICX|nr:hypothetical protein TNCV_2607921 [Trichonephila clavipes]
MVNSTTAALLHGRFRKKVNEFSSLINALVSKLPISEIKAPPRRCTPEITASTRWCQIKFSSRKRGEMAPTLFGASFRKRVSRRGMKLFALVSLYPSIERTSVTHCQTNCNIYSQAFGSVVYVYFNQ